jgi:hypothetical protein
VISFRANALATSRRVESAYTVSSGTAGTGTAGRGTVTGASPGRGSVMTSRAKNTSRGSVEYSRVRCRPRRATFSVSTERLRISADTTYALTDATIMAGSVPQACVSSRVNTTPVSGERITPPSTAARPAIAQNPGNTCGSASPSSAPSAPPIMNVGASTPPEVPEPSDSDQISVLTTRMPMISDTVARPVSSWSITL